LKDSLFKALNTIDESGKYSKKIISNVVGIIDEYNPNIVEMVFKHKLEFEGARRPRVVPIIKNKVFIKNTVYTDPKDKNFRNRLLKLITNDYEKTKKKLIKHHGWVSMKLEVFLKPPINTTKKDLVLIELGLKKPLTKPDVDNYLVNLMNAFNNILYYDDSQITEVSVIKNYTTEESPYFRLTISYDTNDNVNGVLKNDKTNSGS
jgi:Holliday junction resolvase RusA-like endonuclease